VNIVALSTVRLAELQAEVLAIPLVRVPDGSGHGHHNGPAGWINGLSNARVLMYDHPHLTTAVEELQDTYDLGAVRQILVNNMDPGAELSRHRDGYPNYFRYHLPVITNSDAYWWDELEGTLHMAVGSWHGPVPYCGILHSAGNPGTTDRLHVVVDFERTR